MELTDTCMISELTNRINELCDEEDQKNRKKLTAAFVNTLLIQITEDILFDETHGVLHYHRHRIELANQRLKLFCILLEHKGYFIESDRLKEEIWPDGSVSKDALTATAKRLKEDLSSIPGLVIESARGKGYSLKIVSGE